MNLRITACAAALAALAAVSTVQAGPALPGAAPQGFDVPAAQAPQDPRSPQGFGVDTPKTVNYVYKNGEDDEYVVLRGRFTQHLKSDKYEFQDEAGTPITAELDHDRNWSMVHRGKLMEIRAKIDRDWDHTKIEVKSAKPLE